MIEPDEMEEEVLDAEEAAAIQVGLDSLQQHGPVPMEAVLSDLGLTMAEFEAMTGADAFARKLAAAPLDDEPFTEEDRLAVAEADAWCKDHAPIPLEDVLADFGLTMADWDEMGKAPTGDA